MNCSNCASPIPPEAAYCPTCGSLATSSYSASGIAPNDATISSPYANTPPPPSTGYGDSAYGAGAPNQYNAPPSPYGQYYSASQSPQQGPVPPRRNNRLWPLLIAISLVILLVVGGVLALVLHSNSATDSPQSASMPTLPPAQITATAQAHLTATANSVLTATAQAQLTATASVSAANPDPYGAGGKLALLDPLKDNSLGYGWGEGNSGEGLCAFSGGAYHVSSKKPQFFYYCDAGSGTYDNFTFEAHMRILKGDCGGLILRADANATRLYLFEVCRDGMYSFFIYRNSSGDSTLLANGSSPAIKTRLNQVNVLAVTARGSTLTLYVNKHKVTTVSNNVYSQGQVGLVADSYNNQTEVVFSDARLWTL